ncbi:ferredoxin family protein [Sporolactobacillus sp. CQH2019]|uniref:ferredoxin family protein n=1 Tax=Sporolactobacillus sp. CQH2019 TaxID=3023512 RepID=UPI00236787E7|nr:ferredoxin family protein [Sporolactobacillus sp. CQH2019]MDD9148187.1 ferredoxin family protein [Sporolactobacillus sp. CQH2019]
MSIKRQKVEELLGYDKFNVDEQNPHIVLDPEICAKCKTEPCLMVCPAGLYRKKEDNKIVFDYAGCLECGTCRVVCRDYGNKGIVKWVYPNGTFGVHFRYG